MHPYYQKNFQFCPRCGARYNSRKEPLICDQCQFIYYPNPAPTTAVIVEEKGKILLAKRSIEPKKGWWDTPGGFIEINESVEECTIREMKEETGLNVEFLKIIGSAPVEYEDKPTLTIGVHAKIISGTIKPADDVASLHWIDLNEIPEKIGFKSVKVIIDIFKKNY